MDIIETSRCDLIPITEKQDAGQHHRRSIKPRYLTDMAIQALRWQPRFRRYAAVVNAYL